MKTLTEDYVSYEIAVLLKKKGFNGECSGYYEVPTKLYSQKDVSKQLNVIPRNWNEYNKECVVCEYVSISTYQMAMKWLREVHNIHIKISLDSFDGIHPIYEALYDDVTNIRIDNFIDYGDTYEEACEVAIKYCLLNLI